MARPPKHTVDYFPHDATASSGKTLTILEARFGNDGYAFWFKLLETLSYSNNHYYDCRNPLNWEFLQAKTHFDAQKLTEILVLLVDLEAIDKTLWVEKRVIWSDNLVRRIADAYKNRRTTPPPKPSFNDDKPHTTNVSTTDNSLLQDYQGVSTSVNPQTKLNKTKLNNNIYAHNKLFCLFWQAYPKKKSRGQAEKAWIKLNPDKALVELILVAIEKAKKSINWVKDNGQYIPYPATWLNARGWEDEYVVAELEDSEQTKSDSSKYAHMVQK